MKNLIKKYLIIQPQRTELKSETQLNLWKKDWTRAGLGNVRPAKHFNVARELRLKFSK